MKLRSLLIYAMLTTIVYAMLTTIVFGFSVIWSQTFLQLE